MKNKFVVITIGILDPKDKLYKFYELPRKYLGSISLIAKTNDWIRI